MPRFSDVSATVGVALVAASLLVSSVARAETEPKRIVSVGGSVTEILYALGLGDHIVAVDTTSLYPADATTKPNVGYVRALSAEGVLAMSPDMILLETGSGPPDAVNLVDRAGISVVHVPSGFDAGQLPEKIRTVANAVGRGAEGAAIADRAAAELADLQAALAGITERKRVLFILSVVDGRPMGAGTNTAADAMIRMVGAENVLGDMRGYKAVSAEAAAALQPDVVMMVNRGGETGGAENALQLPAFAETPAGRNGALINMDALFLLGFGPRTPQAFIEVAQKLYPELKLTKAD